jgi:hypothetical protein
MLIVTTSEKFKIVLGLIYITLIMPFHRAIIRVNLINLDSTLINEGRKGEIK